MGASGIISHGVSEGGFVVFGALLGLPAEIALAIALAKRVRELALGLPGLIVWQWIEGHNLPRRGQPYRHGFLAVADRAHRARGWKRAPHLLRLPGGGRRLGQGG